MFVHALQRTKNVVWSRICRIKTPEVACRDSVKYSINIVLILDMN